MSAASWIVVTGGGTGIGRALVHHFSRTHRVLTCGRRPAVLRETQRSAPCPANVVTKACDISCADGRGALVAALPADAAVRLLVQNAAIGDPAPLGELCVEHFEAALRVNVVAPLALFQAFLPHLRRGEGRVLHLGTSVAFHPQRGTAVYGVTKMAFHRLYEQLNAEQARSLGLPHVRYFDEAFANGSTTPERELARCVEELLGKDAHAFSAREWRFSEWRKERLGQERGGQQPVGGSWSEWRTGAVRERARAWSGGALLFCAGAVAGAAAGAALGRAR
ncbi:hypothetical protein EMIHUDRAFT_248802 [Emiliania huxleyi CCMP1516]|uniref:Ketoreductase domain-containing protein n=2 Tax=Emiliania huxleyi TaxID=2903 RepID=A0A0D3ID02_EMIH1|nr:hypothetical protein EMIHUDRAFT_248802 [Emiliania huxleyi CCMP1516]EOD09137.1 hypothetical protein EMIHUDRAFT_248802 [Emiliania huxleyi CCMP1516]|eukprot:XP_005761566.1 hypothetical protein EMIHUDRAFT_248802 [Emiliania huxleyi CCMP1516]